MNRIFVIKGISGSGKSSRTFLLLKFLEKVGLTVTDFIYVNDEGRKAAIGKLVVELDLVFIGKVYQSGDIERWQGYDAVTGFFGNSAGFSKFLKDNCGTYNFVVEGAGVTQTNRLRPKFLAELGYDEIMIQYYNYPESAKEDYLNRIIYRSGKKPDKATMWDKNMPFRVESGKSEIEALECSTANSIVFINEFDEPINDLGIKMLMMLDFSEDVVEYFKKFAVEFDYISKNKFENFQ